MAKDMENCARVSRNIKKTVTSESKKEGTKKETAKKEIKNKETTKKTETKKTAETKKSDADAYLFYFLAIL